MHADGSSVGVGGHALHGGYGMVSRKYGLALDWIKGATVVLHNGTVVHCSATQRPSLFWALRGAGASFGIVAELEFNTFPAPSQVTYFDVYLPWTAQTAAAGLKAVQDFGKTMPAEVTMQVFMSKNGYSMDGAYVGDEASLRKVLQPLMTTLGTQIGDARTLGWLDLVAHFAGSGDVNPTSAAYNAVS